MPARAKTKTMYSIFVRADSERDLAEKTQLLQSTLENMGYTVRNVYSTQAQGQQAFMVRMERK